MSTVRNYLSLIKFSHTIFAMPFGMIGFCLGIMEPDLILQTRATEQNSIASIHLPGSLLITKFLLVLVCMITARNAAMAFNRYLDRSFDAKNPRTSIREIPKGIISPDNALRFVLFNSILFICTAFFINRICFYLSPVALFIILVYSYTKRFTSLCHIVLGSGLALAPIGAYLAVTGKFDVLPILFSLAVIFWVSGFDIIYALQDIDFDKSQNLYSVPATFGKSKALITSELLHVFSAACVISAGIYGNFHWLYWLGITVFIFMLIYQHSLVKPNDLSKVNIAFMTANGIASVVFGIFVISDLLIL